jgi:hypothetical protein
MSMNSEPDNPTSQPVDTTENVDAPQSKQELENALETGKVFERIFGHLLKKEEEFDY